MPKIGWHEPFPLVASPRIIDKNVEPTLLLAYSEEERLDLRFVCVIAPDGNSFSPASNHFFCRFFDGSG